MHHTHGTISKGLFLMLEPNFRVPTFTTLLPIASRTLGTATISNTQGYILSIHVGCAGVPFTENENLAIFSSFLKKEGCVFILAATKSRLDCVIPQRTLLQADIIIWSRVSFLPHVGNTLTGTLLLCLYP